METTKKALVDVQMNAADALKQLATAKIRIDELREDNAEDNQNHSCPKIPF